MSTQHAALNPKTLAYKAHSNTTTTLMTNDDDVNCKDLDGRTPLHRAVVTNNLDQVRTLLKHPKIDVNLKDLESGWTALHRALYLGHLRIAILLIQHKDINMAIEDKDRNTAVDICQATLPVSLKKGPCPADALYTWGSNSNFTLGHNDGDDRKIPELVKFPYQTNTITFPRAKSAKPTLLQLSMSKFHTAISTSEPGFTAKLWGFGTNGRLGTERKMQLSPAPVSGISGNVVFTALGRDHTILVTAKGEVYTLGNNKYGQLGYSLEIPKNGQDPIQYSPKRVVLNIARLAIVGAAASKWHTVIHTNNELFTFGFNYGQLGYERKGDVQLGPRKVASIPSGLIMQVAASDSATACLMSSNDVIVFHKYAYHKVSFSLFPYPDWFSNMMMGSVLNENRPSKIACSENKFGMMTGWGDIHVWSYPEVDAAVTLGSLPPNHSIPFSSTSVEKPRRVWTYGGERTHAIDFALGQNGSVIMLTKGGHVYIGTNKGNSFGRNVKWQRIPHLDRVVQVCANPSGTWAAMRSESTLTPVFVRPGCISSNLEQSLSQFHMYRNNEKNWAESKIVDDDDDDDDDSKVVADPWRIDIHGWQDIEKSWDYDVVPLLDLTTKLTNNTGTSVSGSHLFDVELQAGKRVLGAHRIILAARSPVFQRAFVDTPQSKTNLASLVTIVPNTFGSAGRSLYTVLLRVEFTTAVLLLQFLYSDRFDPFWDALDLPKTIKHYALKVRQELYHLSLELSLPTLQAALQYSFTHVCSVSLSKNMGQVIRDPAKFQSLADVRLLLKDGASMDLHQMVLGHRSPFFNAMLVRTDEWVRSRQGQRRLPGTGGEVNDSILEVDMKHMDLEAMTLAVKYIYTDCGPEMFNDTEKDEMDDLIRLVMDVLQIADELLIDRLKEICENVLGEQVRAKTVVTFLEFSVMYAADSLKATCIDYLCHNIEMALDQRWLQGVDDDIVTLVEQALVDKQDAFMPFVRSGRHLPDPAAVEEMSEAIKMRGFRFYKPWGLYYDRLDVSKVTQNSQGRESEQGPSATRSASVTTFPDSMTPPPSPPVPLLSVSARSLSASSLRAESKATGASEDRFVLGQKLERSGSDSNTENILEWPMLSDKLVTDARDIPALSRRKTSWDQVPGVESSQLTCDDQENGASEGPSKPSLREILEHEQRQGQANVKAAAALTPSTTQKTSKLSQKERRKLLLQQQQGAPSSSELPQTTPTPAAAWAKVPSANVLDLNLPGGVNESNTPRRQSSLGGNIIAGMPPIGTPSLLDIQQSELALFRTQPKEVPRVAIATSKPVKETMRLGGSERTFSEAPWRLDAIPEPLRAVTRHQSQMYPKLESSSHSYAPSTGPTTSPSLGPARANLPSTTSSLSNGASVDLVAATSGTPTLTAMAFSASGMSVLTGSASASSLSSFAIIQNQQLRDRNMLLKARHHKKSLYQIQIEEQALSQIQSMNLERVRAKAAEGTGEWFTCKIGQQYY
ncbi:hypothetical protein EDD21DRAFT_366830 [Dissophora ornata]|nr:hypothetical protein BGZ58_005980 [Dissophora ornata]KAI8604226.1 hypothetical protein EDD21DRAFT_366830 [Dissophora ornata]